MEGVHLSDHCTKAAGSAVAVLNLGRGAISKAKFPSEPLVPYYQVIFEEPETGKPLPFDLRREAERLLHALPQVNSRSLFLIPVTLIQLLVIPAQH